VSLTAAHPHRPPRGAGAWTVRSSSWSGLLGGRRSSAGDGGPRRPGPPRRRLSACRAAPASSLSVVGHRVDSWCDGGGGGSQATAQDRPRGGPVWIVGVPKLRVRSVSGGAQDGGGALRGFPGGEASAIRKSRGDRDLVQEPSDSRSRSGARLGSGLGTRALTLGGCLSQMCCWRRWPTPDGGGRRSR